MHGKVFFDDPKRLAMPILETNVLTEPLRVAILALWNQEYPASLNYTLADFEAYLNGLKDNKHYLLWIGDAIMGWAFSFKREDEKWFAIILDQNIQRQGYGTQLLDKIKEKEPVLNGWVSDHDNAIKSNGEKYKSPLGFYIKNKFLVTSARLETEKLSAVKITWKRE